MGTRRSVVRTAGRPVLLLSALLTAAAACGRSDGSDDDPRADTSATSPADSTQPAPPDEVPWRDALTERYVPDLADADAARYCSVDQRWKGIRWTTEEPAWRTNAELQRSLLADLRAGRATMESSLPPGSRAAVAAALDDVEADIEWRIRQAEEQHLDPSDPRWRSTLPLEPHEEALRHRRQARFVLVDETLCPETPPEVLDGPLEVELDTRALGDDRQRRFAEEVVDHLVVQDTEAAALAVLPACEPLMDPDPMLDLFLYGQYGLHDRLLWFLHEEGRDRATVVTRWTDDPPTLVLDVEGAGGLVDRELRVREAGEGYALTIGHVESEIGEASWELDCE